MSTLRIFACSRIVELNMGEREPRKEHINKGELFYLSHPESEDVFSGYGLAVDEDRMDRLAGLLMVDRPHPADPKWLQAINDTYGECRLVPMTASGDRGLACQMRIEENSLRHLRRFPSNRTSTIQKALEPLLEEPPAPKVRLRWEEDTGLWLSEFAGLNELPLEIRDVFEKTGYGCLAAETNIGIVHVCHANDSDIEGFANKPVISRWKLIEMPTAPLIRLELIILDRPENPYRFESFLNVAADDQAQVLANMANQDELHLAFYGDGLQYRYTKSIPHTEQQWQQLDELVELAVRYREEIPVEQRDFDLAKAAFMIHSL